LGFRSDVAELMQAADVVVHCSTAPEPFGRVIVEGMLSRRPVIASAAGGAVEIIDHERTGLLTEIGCVNKLAAAMRELVDDTNQANRLAEAGYHTARQRFRLTTQLQEINRVIASHVVQQVPPSHQTTTEEMACRLPSNS
jgi:glycosyltransferase involved in cell wall biosynthesis